MGSGRWESCWKTLREGEEERRYCNLAFITIQDTKRVLPFRWMQLEILALYLFLCSVSFLQVWIYFQNFSEHFIYLWDADSKVLRCLSFRDSLGNKCNCIESFYLWVSFHFYRKKRKNAAKLQFLTKCAKRVINGRLTLNCNFF